MKRFSSGRNSNPLLPRHLNQKLYHFSQLDLVGLLSKAPFEMNCIETYALWCS